MASWYVCNVDRAGIFDSDSTLGPDVPNYPTWLILTDTGGAFTQAAFSNDDPNTGNQMLAVALTAVAAQRQVRAFLDMPGTVDPHDPGFCYRLEIVVNLP